MSELLEHPVVSGPRGRFSGLFWLTFFSVLAASTAAGLMVWVPRLQRQRAMERVHQLGGALHLAPPASHPGERVLDEISGVRGSRVAAIDLSAAELDDADMDLFAAFPEVRYLTIGGENLTDDALRALSGHERLQRLILVNAPQISEEAERELERAIPGLRISRRGPALLGVYGEATPMGCLIVNVRRGTAAERGGIRTGDVVTAINGRRVTDFESLAGRLAHFRPGQTVTVSVLRERHRFELPITLGTWQRLLL